MWCEGQPGWEPLNGIPSLYAQVRVTRVHINLSLYQVSRILSVRSGSSTTRSVSICYHLVPSLFAQAQVRYQFVMITQYQSVITSQCIGTLSVPLLVGARMLTQTLYCDVWGRSSLPGWPRLCRLKAASHYLLYPPRLEQEQHLGGLSGRAHLLLLDLLQPAMVC